MAQNINKILKKIVRLIKNPRLVILNRFIASVSPQTITTMARYKLVNPITVADHFSAKRMWNGLKDLAKHDHEFIFKNISSYLELKSDNFIDNKQKISDSIADEIKKTDMLQKLSPDRLFAVSRLLGQFSFFDAAAACRFASLGRLGLAANPGGFNRNAICAELNGVDVQTLQVFAERYGLAELVVNCLVNFAQKATVYELLEQLKSNSATLEDIRMSELGSSSCHVFKQLRSARLNLAKKKVLLIGPSVRESVTLNHGDFDLIARIGYRGPTSIASFKEYETDVSFYKNHKLDDLSSEEITTITKSLDVMIVSGITSSTVEKFEDISKCFYSPVSGATLITAECNAGLEAILVILEAGADLVYVTNTDLFLNSVYPEGYKSNNYDQIDVVGGWVHESEILCRSLARHHAPSAQYCIYQTLWRSGKIRGDTVFEEIMKNGLIRYLKRLEETYHPFVSGLDPVFK